MTTEASASTRPTARATAATRRAGRRAVRLRTAMRERRDLLTHARESRMIAVGGDHALPVGRLRQNRPPRIDDHGAPVGREAGGQRAVLIGGDDEALVLDRPGAQ